jgi:chromosome segregation ATPase
LVSRAEKERLVVELSEQGKSIRQIAEELHLSFGTISSIIRRHNGNLQTVEAHNIEQKVETIDTRAFKLFEDGKTPVKVAIELDPRSDDVTKLYTQYLKLKALEELSLLYEERRDDLHEFHNAYRLMVNESLTPRQLIDAANHMQELPSVKSRCELIKREIEGLEYQREEVYNTIVTAKQDLNSINLGIDVQKKEFERLSNEKRQYESLIASINNGAGCSRIRAIAETTATSILTDNMVVLGAAFRALLQALSEEPRNELQLIIYGSLRYPLYEPRNGNPPQNYIQLRQAVLLQSAEETYQDLVGKVVKSTMSSALDIPDGSRYPRSG